MKFFPDTSLDLAIEKVMNEAHFLDCAEDYQGFLKSLTEVLLKHTGGSVEKISVENGKNTISIRWDENIPSDGGILELVDKDTTSFKSSLTNRPSQAKKITEKDLQDLINLCLTQEFEIEIAEDYKEFLQGIVSAFNEWVEDANSEIYWPTGTEGSPKTWGVYLEAEEGGFWDSVREELEGPKNLIKEGESSSPKKQIKL